MDVVPPLSTTDVARMTRDASFPVVLLLLTTLLVFAPQGVHAQEESKNNASTETRTGVTAPGAKHLGIGAGLYFENSRREGEEVRQAETTDESFDYKADDFLSGSVWYLRTIAPRIRAGAGLHYFGSYEVLREPTEEEQQQDEEPDIEAFELGQMVTPFARLEWVVPLFDATQVLLGAEAGPTVLFPDGEFRRSIDSMEDEDISVSTAPRLGVDIAPMLGARWEFDRRVALRADFSVHWQRLFLFNVDDNVEGVAYERTWTAKILRYSLGFSMEVKL